MAVSHSSQVIIPQSVESNKATFAATGMPELERDIQCISELQALDLPMILQHQLLRIWIQVYLLVYPEGTGTQSGTG